MDITLFTILWVAYLQVHQFEPNLESSQSTSGTEWVCKHDNTKIVRLDGPSASLNTADKEWKIYIREDSIAGISNSYYDDDQHQQFGGSVVVFSNFGPTFESWLANAFESVKCDPASHIDFSDRIKLEKAFVTVLQKISDSSDSPDPVEYPPVYFPSDTGEVMFHHLHAKDTDEESNSNDIYIL